MRLPRLISAVKAAADYTRGFEDGRKGIDRWHGSDFYRQGYDDGLDQYDRDHCEEEGWPCV